MKIRRFATLTASWIAILIMNGVARADEWVTQDEMSAKAQWVKHTLLSPEHPVVSFRYNGTSSEQLLAGWRKTPIETQQLSDGRTQYVMRWTDPVTGLEVRVVAVEYGDYPAVEWTAYMRNRGAAATPILEEVRGIDSNFGIGKETILRTNQGDFYSPTGYEPLEFKLENKPRGFQPSGGRPTDQAWPYFNLDSGREGVFLALGWPGQWQAQFASENNVAKVRGGQETTHLSLQPGEEIRTPLVAVLFWKGEDWLVGQNLWRHWFVAHNMPRYNGRLPGKYTEICMGLHQSAAGEKAAIDTYVKSGVAINYWHMDAGWYEGSDWWAAKGVGTWTPDPIRFPHGIREVSDYAHDRGMKLGLWYEPERVYNGSFLWESHPDWLLKWDDPGMKDLRLLNLGNPAALRWLTDTLTQSIAQAGPDIYKQDFNVAPLKAWQNNDAPDRQGMTENLYVQGLLEYWDALRRRFPDMIIDSCASGGRRFDLESLRRALSLCRSDYQAPSMGDPGMTADVFDANQGFTYGLSLWIPYFGTGEYAEDVYSARSHLSAEMGVGTHLERPDWNALYRQVSDYCAVADYFYGDYYPLTPYSRAADAWIAWEFVRPEKGDGMIQAFRHEFSTAVEIRLKLRGLKADVRYEFTNRDGGGTTAFSGKELMEAGLPLTAAAPRTALLLTFREVK